MVDRERYRRGSHTVTELKYHLVGWGYWVTIARGAEDGLCGAGDDNCARQHSAESCSSTGECPCASVASEDGTVSQGQVILPVAAGVSGIIKKAENERAENHLSPTKAKNPKATPLEIRTDC